MPQPKKNHSHQRQQKRRANWKGTLVALVACNNCGQVKRPHHVCDSCGYYNGRKMKEPTNAQA